MSIDTNYQNWYVGITSNIQQRFQDHNVRENSFWMYATTDSIDIAREVEQIFLDTGCDGGAGGGDDKSVIVYIYRKTWYTNP